MKRRSGTGLVGIMAFLIACVGAWGEPATVGEYQRSPTARIALIIDDLGYMPGNDHRAVALDGPVACAILPHTPYAARVAERAHAAGKEVLLHLPLQPMTQFEATSAGTIQIDTTKSEMLRILTIGLAAIPHVVGVNNHQGSLLTRHPGHMTWLMNALRSRGDLFFVDSFTSDASVALLIAREQGVPSTRRDVFLDTTPTLQAIDAEFRRLKRRARSHGVAVGIGHPYTVTLDYLEQAIPALLAEGFELIPVSKAIMLQSRPAIQTAHLDGPALERQGFGR